VKHHSSSLDSLQMGTHLWEHLVKCEGEGGEEEEEPQQQLGYRFTATRLDYELCVIHAASA
jgi:hypothetical protein